MFFKETHYFSLTNLQQEHHITLQTLEKGKKTCSLGLSC